MPRRQRQSSVSTTPDQSVRINNNESGTSSLPFVCLHQNDMNNNINNKEILPIFFQWSKGMILGMLIMRLLLWDLSMPEFMPSRVALVPNDQGVAGPTHHYGTNPRQPLCPILPPYSWTWPGQPVEEAAILLRPHTNFTFQEMGYWTATQVSYSEKQAPNFLHFQWHYSTPAVLQQPKLPQINLTKTVSNLQNFERQSLVEIMQRATTNNNISVVLYGSSHLRALYFDLIRLERGVKWNEPLEETITYIPSGLPADQQEPTCDPGKTGYRDGKYGIDLQACGAPGRRLVPELAPFSAKPKVAFGFKTFLHTPDADDEFVDWLQSQSLPPQPSILIIDIGIWEFRGQRMASNNNTYPRTQTNLTQEQEVQYYFDWLATHFVTSKLVVVYEYRTDAVQNLVLPRFQQWARARIETPEQIGVKIPDTVILRKDFLMATRHKRIPCGHGCSGPLTMVLASLLLDWIAKATNGPERCI